MTRHDLTYIYEERWSRFGAEGAGIERYPCLPGCCRDGHRHDGVNMFIYARCSCGWEEMVGDYIREATVLLEGRLRHLQHQIDALACAGTVVVG